MGLENDQRFIDILNENDVTAVRFHIAYEEEFSSLAETIALDTDEDSKEIVEDMEFQSVLKRIFANPEMMVSNN